jgi:predicted RNA-binding Zn-ribbon protein involved in translation (DUF1610 family)
MATTGTIAIATGSYECQSCRHVIALRSGDVAPKCPECRHETGWHFRDTTRGPSSGEPARAEGRPVSDA